MDVPRPEYPRPQWARPDWLNLNGPWQFEIDVGDSGLERGLAERDLADRIVVPFCPESPLSGIEHTDFMNAVWYRREVAVPKDWAGRRVLLHIGAADYEATVWANGTEVGRHRGGFTPFTCDLTGAAAPGEAVTLVIRCRDDARIPKPRGKQCPDYANRGCLYTRTTGLWQTVWLEPVPAAHLQRPHIVPDLARPRFRMTQPVAGPAAGMTVRATLTDEAGEVASDTCPVGPDFTPTLDLVIPDERVRPWSPDDPHLYGLAVELLDAGGDVVDRAESYAGLRAVGVDGLAMTLNGKPLFQRLVLDQGYWPDGVMTAPSDEALEQDIRIAMEAGFNGARLHQKVVEDRFLYHADRLGYLVWGEFGDWGIRTGERGLAEAARHQPAAAMLAQWLEVLRRDVNHPSIVGWCPLNEVREVRRDRMDVYDDLTRGLVDATHLADPTRPVLEASGYAHRSPATDVWDSHDYTQDPAELRERHAATGEGRPYVNVHYGESMSQPYGGQPVMVSEFGGIWWNPGAPEGDASWGYGDRPQSEAEFYERFEGLTGALLETPGLFGYCYTQLTDVYQEQNGVVRFDRSRKLDLARLRAAQQRPAAAERG